MTHEFRLMILSCAVAVGSCTSKPTDSQDAPAAPAAVQPADGGHPSPELLAVASIPAASKATFSFDDYGAESGSVGIPECDECVQRATKCAAEVKAEHSVAVLAETKQRWLAWKRAARQATSHDERAKLRAQCQEAVEALGKELEAVGCRTDSTPAAK